MKIINKEEIETYGIIAYFANPEKTKRYANEYKSIDNLNKYIEDISNQIDSDLYFPFIAKVNNRYMLIPYSCKII